MKKVIFILLSSTVFFSCLTDINNPEKPLSKNLYFSSFENGDCIKGWYGIFEGNLVDDPAPGGGSKSVFLGGGCGQPTAYIDLISQHEDSYYKLKFWAKVQQASQKGWIELLVSHDLDSKKKICIFAQGAEWTEYESDELLFCPAESELELRVHIGGIIYASMNIDRLTIERVEK
ncbi:hypothetical protein ACFL4T_11605 [candidate division KSB1 bacterium]